MVMNRFTIICALLIAGAVSIRSQPASQTQPPSPSSKSWVVEGNVADDRGPVQDVSVYASGVGRALTAVTDTKGRFMLTGTASGLYRISPSKEGYEGYDRGDLQNFRNLELMAGSRVTRADFVIHKAASISGRILDPDRNPVQGAVVVLQVKHFVQGRPYLETIGGAESEASGDYRIAGLKAGEDYYLSVAPSFRDNQAVSPNGHREPQVALVQTFYPNATSVDNAAPIYLNRAEQREGVDLIMGQAVTFCVTAMPRFELGNLLGASWRISYRDGGAFAMGNGSLKPGEDLAVCRLPPGSYDLWIMTFTSDRITGFISQTFIIGNRNVAIGELYPNPPIPLRGKVIVADAPTDNPAPALSIEVGSLNRRQLHFFAEGNFGLSNSKGEFSIPDLFADDYELVAVRHLPPGFYVKALTQAGRDVTRESIRPGDDLTITILSDGPVISGKAVDKDTPVHDATVILIPKDQGIGSVVSVRSDQNGRFQIQSGIAPGDYSIVALTGLFGNENQNPEFLRDQMTRATTLALDKKETKVVTLNVRAAH